MVERMFGGSGSGGFGGGGNWNFNSLFKMDDISDKTVTHLQRVYGTHLASAVFAVVGAFINQTFMFEGILLTIVQIVLSGYLIYQVH